MQLESVPSCAGTEIQRPSMAKAEGRALNLRQWLVVRAVELGDRRDLVVPEIGMDDDSGIRSAPVEIEQSAPERSPLVAEWLCFSQGCGHVSSSRSTGFITRRTGSRPTVSSQYGVR